MTVCLTRRSYPRRLRQGTYRLAYFQQEIYSARGYKGVFMRTMVDTRTLVGFHVVFFFNYLPSINIQ